MARRKAAGALAEGHVGVPMGPHVEEFLIKPTFDEDGVQASAGIGPDGKEHVDPTPMAPPVGYQAPPDILVMVRDMINAERLRQLADSEGFDTPEEADDFEIEDDPVDPLTPYEAHFFPPKDVTPAAGGPSQKEAPTSASVVAGRSEGQPAPAAAERSEAPGTKVT